MFEFEAWLPKVSTVVQQFAPISSHPAGIKKQLKEAEASIFNFCKIYPEIENDVQCREDPRCTFV